MSVDSGSTQIPFVKIDDIASKRKYSCVGGPFGSSLSRKHYVEEEAVPVIRGTNLGGDQFIDDGFVFVSEEKGDKLHRNLAYPGDIIFTQRGTLGQVAIIPSDVRFDRYVVSQSQMKLTVDEEKADPYYVYSYFRSKEAKKVIENNAIIGGVPHINLGILKAIEIPLPSLMVQKEIAQIIKSLDDKIELNRQINKTLEQIAQAIFKSWFVDFEPVKAKIEAKQNGQDPEHAAMRVISGKTDEQLGQLSPEQRQQLITTVAHFPYELVDSELGEIPKGWSVKSIEELANVVLGGTPSRKKPEYWGGDIPWINSGAVNNSRVVEAVEYITEEGFNRSSTKMMPKGTVLIAITGATMGKISRIEIDACGNQSIVGVMHNGHVSSEFLYLTLLNTIERLLSKSTGAAQQHINKNNVSEHIVFVPCEKLEKIFANIVQPIFEQIAEKKFEAITLGSARDLLLPKLLSGEVALADDQITVEAVAG